MIDAGRQLFGERGYAAVSTPEIVAAAGVSRGALSHHFDDKQALFAAVVEAVEAEVTERLAGMVAGVNDPLEAARRGRRVARRRRRARGAAAGAGRRPGRARLGGLA